jgi:hypothetical protein
VEVDMIVRFAVPSSITSWEKGMVASPACKTAYYLCMLAGRNRLSLRDLFIVQKIGFSIVYLYTTSEDKQVFPEEGGINTFLWSSSVISFLDKLAKIQALIERSSSEGERQAAESAKERILAKFWEQQANLPIDYRVSLDSPWKKRLFVALCSKHGFQTYRYPRQKYTTARLKVSKNFMEEILWPEFLRYSNMLEELVEEILRDLTNKIHEVQEEVEVAGEIS